MNTFARDVRYALRTLRNSPSFSLVAVAALALGIGANTSIFSLYNALALRPLPVRDPARVARLFQTHRGEPGAGVFSYPQYLDYRDNSGVFSGLAAWSWTGLTMGTSGHAEPVSAMVVSGNYFSVLGAQMAAGRAFLPEEDGTPGAHAVVVLGYGFWKRRFDGDPMVGSRIPLNGQPFTVVGVASPRFVGTDAVAPDVWVPLAMDATLVPDRKEILHDRNGHWLQVIGRLTPGMSWRQARAALDVLSRRLVQVHPEDKDSGVQVASATFIPPNIEKQAAPLVILVMGAVGLVLLTACANVANLLLARASARQKEIGIRASLGATRGQLMRQLLTESLVMSAFGGVAGLALASWVSAALLRLVHPPFERGAFNFDVSPDIRILSYTLAISTLTGIVFGLVPAIKASGLGLSNLMKAGSLARGRSWTGGALVVTQVALCVVLLVAAGLLLRALGRAQTTDPGFDTRNVIALSLDLRLHHYDDAAARDFERRVLERLQSAPGVKAASLAVTVPLGTAFMATGLEIEGQGQKPGENGLVVSQNLVSPRFFETLGIPVLRGRGFTSADSMAGPEVAIVNETLAQRWTGGEAVGKRIRIGESKGYATIVGVVKNTRSSYLWDASEPYVYMPVRNGSTPAQDLNVLIRSSGDSRALVGALPGLVRALDPSVQVSTRILEENLETWIWPSRVGATLAASLGLLALTLAAVGIYGVVAYTVGRRTREIGIHVALGAQRGDVLLLVLRRGLMLVGIGLGVGLAAAIALGRLLAGFLYGLGAADPVTFAGVAAVLCAAAILANYLPALRALRVDPAAALRCE